MISFSPTRKRLEVFMLAAATLLMGCARTSDTLEYARSAYVQAKATPDIVSYAPAAMDEAEKALEKAENAETYKDTEHFAHMAKRNIELAVVTAERKIADKKIELLSRRTQNARPKPREHETAQTEREIKSEATFTEPPQYLSQQAEQAKKKAEDKDRKAEIKASEREKKASELALKAREAEARAREAKASRKEPGKTITRVMKLKREKAQLKPERTQRGMALTLGDVLFESGSPKLMADADRELDKIARFLNKNSDRKVLIEGHADSRSSDRLNLSQARADTVRDALVGKGVSKLRIITRGYGRSYPIATNKTEEGRQKNRRVEIILLNKGISPKSMFR